MLALMLLVLSAVGTPTARCDMIEVNHVYGEDGAYRFTQVIAWEWLPDYCVHRVQDWKFIKRWQMRDGAFIGWGDSECYRAHPDLFRETWTQFDAEMRDREMFPVDKRVRVFAGN